MATVEMTREELLEDKADVLANALRRVAYAGHDVLDGPVLRPVWTCRWCGHSQEDDVLPWADDRQGNHAAGCIVGIALLDTEVQDAGAVGADG